MSVVNSVLLYESEVWANITKMSKYRKKITSVQWQSAQKIASEYHTVSLAAIQVVASVIPIDLLVLERKYIYDSVEEREMTSTRARSNSMNAWQERWDEVEKGRWTHRMISDLQAWTERQHGEVDYYFTRFLTGYGYFRYMLKKWHKLATGQCLPHRS